jgi:hypothetical protein
MAQKGPEYCWVNKSLEKQLQKKGCRLATSFFLSLMFWSQQIKNGLYRTECRDGNLHKNSIPTTHGSIPQARHLKSLD